MFNITEIFKAYDVRGIYPTDLNEDIAYKGIQEYIKHLEKYKEDIDNWLQKSE